MKAQLSIKFIASYLAIFVATVWVFYNIDSRWMEAITAQTSSYVLGLFGHTTRWWVEGFYTFLYLNGQNPVTVNIIRECTALNVLGVMTGLILPLRASFTNRILGVILSGVLLFTMNIPRIMLTIYLTAYDTWPFTTLANRNLETYHYPISFAFGVIGVAITVLAVTKLTTPELGNTLLDLTDKITSMIQKPKPTIARNETS